MIKYLAIGTLGLVLTLAGNSAKAHDEAAYFLLGAIVGSTLTRHSGHHATVVYHAPAYPHVYYPPPPVVVVERRHYVPVPVHVHRAEVRHRHPLGGPPGKRRHSRGR